MHMLTESLGLNFSLCVCGGELRRQLAGVMFQDTWIEFRSSDYPLGLDMSLEKLGPQTRVRYR